MKAKKSKSYYVCYHCHKFIKTVATINNPPAYLLDLGLEFLRAYHPSCYRKAEEMAAKELAGKAA